VRVDEDELTHAKNKAEKSILTCRDVIITGGCKTPLGVVDTDEVSIRNILGSCQIAAIMKSLNQPFQIGWKYHDNVIRTLTADEMIGVGLVVMQHVSVCYSVSWAMKDALDAAVTIAEVEAIDLVAPWVAIESNPKHVPVVDPEDEPPVEPVDEPPVEPEEPEDEEPEDPEITPPEDTPPSDEGEGSDGEEEPPIG
jgi:hypothetical protein